MKTLIIDTSYLIYRSYFAYPKLTYNNEPVGAFFGFAKTILELVRDNKPDQLVFAGDTSEPTWRHQIVDDYKAGRAQIEDAMVSQFPLINHWCKMVSKNVFKYSGWEADDIIFSIAVDELTQFRTICKRDLESKPETLNDLFGDSSNVKFIPEFPIRFDELVQKSKASANEILIYSSDRDLYQMLSLPNLRFIHSNKGVNEYFGINEFKAKYQLHPLQWLDYKALVGDPGDNLKGVEGIGPKTATTILQEVGCLYSLFAKMNLDNKPFFRTAGACWAADNDINSYFQNTKNSKIIEKLKQNYQVIKHTYLMSSLQSVPEVKFENTGFVLSGSLDYLEKYGFKSLQNMIKKLEPQNVEQEGLF
jgi:DNA polymerase I